MVFGLLHLAVSIIAIILIILIAVYIISKRSLRKKGIKGYEIYSDMEKRSNEVFYSESLNLVGKPDRITMSHSKPVVWEYKSRSAPATPYHSHVVQLTAYALLVEEKYKMKVTKGIIRYADRTFEINIDTSLKNDAVQMIKQMQQFGKTSQIFRNHNNPARCLKCEFQDVCKFKLIN